MKKINFLFIFLGLSVVIVLIIALVSNEPKTIKLTTFKKAYNYVSEYQVEEEIIVNLILNRTDTYLTDMNNISNGYIIDQEKNNQIKLNIKEINRSDEEILINGDKFYSFNYLFTIDLKTENDFSLNISDAFLSLDYIQNEEIKIAIGSFSFYKINSFGGPDLSISRLKGLVNDIDDYKTLVGLQVEFKNNSNKEISILNLIPLDNNLQVSNNDVKQLTEYDNLTNQNINQILGYDYNLKTIIDNQDLNLTIDQNDSNMYLLPLKYKTELMVNKLGFIVEYKLDNEIKTFYFDDFTFFSNYLYSKSEVNDLIIYTYGNH